MSKEQKEYRASCTECMWSAATYEHELIAKKVVKDAADRHRRMCGHEVTEKALKSSN